MRILVISQYFWPENFRLNDLCLELTDRGHHVEVLTGIPNYPQGIFYKGYSVFKNRIEKWRNITIHRAFIIPRGRDNRILLVLNYLSFVFSSCFKLLFLKGNYDKIIVYQLSPATVGFPGILAKKLFRAPLFFYIQDLWPESIKDAGGIRSNSIIRGIDLLMNMFYKISDSIIVQSPAFTEYLVSKGIHRNKITYISNTVEPFYKPEIKTSKYIDKFPSGFNILFAGNIGKAQDLYTIADAANMLYKKKLKINWIFLGDGRDKDNVIEYVKELGISEVFYFLGSFSTQEMPFFFACADVLLVSLKRSTIFSLTIPSKVQSYFACKKPILGNIDGISFDIINNYQCGYASNSADSVALSENTEKLYYSSRTELENFGNNAFEYFRINFERTQIYNKLETLLLDVK